MTEDRELSVGDRSRLAFLTPKIPYLENFGIFDGTKTIERDQSVFENLPEGIIIEVLETNTGSSEQNWVVKLDYYAYVNYIRSYVNESGELATRTLNEDQYLDALSRNAIIDVQKVTISESDILYEVRVDFFKYALNQTPEDTYFWLGTTEQGLDLFKEMWGAARISIFLAFLVTVINLIIGLFLGSIIGYYGGWLDILFDRLVDIISGLPFLATLTILVLAYGSQWWVIVIAFVLVGWIGAYARTRMQFYRFKGREYVLAARTLGSKDMRLMYKHIMPNAIGTLITSFSLSIPAFMFSEATFSFLGIINYGETTSIGQLLSIGQSYMQNHPHLLIYPAIYISTLMLSFNLFGNGLRDAFNPSLRGVE